jgi:hypothetical protein
VLVEKIMKSGQQIDLIVRGEQNVVTALAHRFGDESEVLAGLITKMRATVESHKARESTEAQSMRVEHAEAISTRQRVNGLTR